MDERKHGFYISIERTRAIQFHIGIGYMIDMKDLCFNINLPFVQLYIGYDFYNYNETEEL